MKSLKDKIRDHSVIADNGCWVWTGGKARGGYGKTTHNGKCGVAHRFVYEEMVGPVPAGLQLDHLCRNPACINPAHLEPVTPKENLMRGNTLQKANAAKTHCPQGHEYTHENTYRHADGRRVCIACRRIRDLMPGPAARRREYKRRIRQAKKKGDL